MRITRLSAAVLLVIGGQLTSLTPVGAAQAPQSLRATKLTASDWRTLGHDAQHTFSGVTTLTPSKAPTLAPAWFFQTGDAVTANPIAVAHTVYVGSWDGYFYAINRSSGTLKWKYQVKPQPAITPAPGSPNRDLTGDGGIITSSAWFEPGKGTRPDLVIFGGGYTLYALVAATGQLYWSHDYTGRPELPPDPANDGTRIFSSPIVAGNQVVFGVSSDGDAGHRGYVASADLKTGNLNWRFETDVDTAGVVQNDGCGGVWSSASLNRSLGLVYIGVSDCNAQGLPPYHERELALHVSDGSLAWAFTPPRLQGVAPGQDPPCDFDFGATANLGLNGGGGAGPTFLGVGGKDGTYYSLNPATGALKWATNVVFGGTDGGFLGTTAFDGHRIYGATAFGDLPPPCEPGNPRDVPFQDGSPNPADHSMHALSAQGGVVWEQYDSLSFGSTTIAGGMTFVGHATVPEVQVRDGATGTLLTTLPTAANCFCGIAVAGNAVFFGTGTPQQVSPDGVYAFTPLGAPPES